MTDVKIVEIKHIKGIPDEFLDSTIDSGYIRKGKTITLLVELIGNSYERIFIDLFLEEGRQENIIKINNIIPVEEKGDFFVLSENWKSYEPLSRYHLHPD